MNIFGQYIKAVCKYDELSVSFFFIIFHAGSFSSFFNFIWVFFYPCFLFVTAYNRLKQNITVEEEKKKEC